MNACRWLPVPGLLLAAALALSACAVPAAEGASGVSGPAAAQSAAPSAEAAAPAPVTPPPPASAAPSSPPATPPRPGAVTVVPILMYHYIRELPPTTPDKLGYGLSVSPKLFEDQLGYLAGAGYHSVSMDDLTAHIVSGTPLPPKPVVLTFDDGYADFFTAALPLLKKYHFGATSYLVVDFLGKPGYMSWQQAQDIRGADIEIGAHTLDHVDLAIQPLPQSRRQIDDSRHVLQQRLEVPVNSFAYPSGRYTAATVKEVAEAGFTSAVTTNAGAKHTVGSLLTLSRVRVPGGITLPNFIRSLGG